VATEATPSPILDAVTVTRLFIEALNARDVESLRSLIDANAEFPTRTGRTLRGAEGIQDLVNAGRDTDLLLVRTGVESVDEGSAARVRVRTPVREIVRRSRLDGRAIFEVAGDRIASFEVVTEEAIP
jgi:hypothetical protein